MAAASITRKLVLLFACSSVAVLLALGYLFSAKVAAHFEDEDRGVLEAELDAMAGILAEVRSREAMERRVAWETATAGHPLGFVVVLTPKGEPLAASSPSAASGVPEQYLRAPASANQAQAASPGATLRWSSGADSLAGRTRIVPTQLPEFPEVLVFAALSTAAHERFMAWFGRTLWIAIGLAAAGAALLGWLIVKSGLSPVRDLASTVSNITANRLSERVSTERVPAELQELAAAFNGMLERIDASFSRLNEYSADLAHEFRTPIASLVTQTQVTLSRARSVEEYREVLYSSLETYDRLARMTSDMLYLAKAERHADALGKEQVDLAAEARAVLDFYAPLADEQGVRFTQSGEGSVEGDPGMIRRAVSNLMSNAIRHGRRDSEIGVTITQATGEVRLEVANRGAPIPAELLPKLFERFSRDASASENEQGGLGLAIAKAIMEAHGGRVNVSAGEDLTVFVLAFPAAAQSGRGSLGARTRSFTADAGG